MGLAASIPTSPTAGAFRPPDEFDDYLIERELGRGQMGQVFLAEDTVLARPVAIKFIASVEPDVESRARFLMEARAVARIQHPNVASVFRVGELGDRMYIVSELVRGKPLDELPRSLPAAQVLDIAIDLARGLTAAHRRGVVHCDIKPGNVMVTDEGVAKLVDFGLARVVHSHDSDEGAGTMTGTPDYMAPEVWRGRAASRRSDVYSFGAVLFELLAGKPPFADVDARQLGTTVSEQDAPALAVPGVDPRLARLVARCLERDPDRRFASGEELRDALEQLHPSRVHAVKVDENPYRGLRTFESAHRGLFFGRGLEIGAIVERLRTDSIVIVTGDSGVGKSSLCRAGVIPAIVDGALGGSWDTFTMVPGRRPLAALAAALGDPSIAERVLADPEALPRELRRRGGDKGVLLFVDQMEELATVGDPDEVAALDAGLARISEGIPNVRLVTTVRADFLTKIAALPRLGRELSRLLYFVSPLASDRIREVITGPAAATNVEFESEDIVTSLVDATAQAGSGGLPLLSFALAELWEARDRERRTITQAAVEAMGGVAGALARHGDAVLATMPATDRVHVRRVLLRLVTSLGTRVRRTEAELSTSDRTRAALDALVKGRLLVVHDADGGATYELAHEVLVHGWGTLRDWLDADAKDLARRERVAAAAAEWQRSGRRSDLTWRGPRLVEARALDPTSLTTLEREFIAASARAAQQRIWLRRAVAIGVVVAALAIFFGQRYVAKQRLAAAVAKEVAAARIEIDRARTADRAQREHATQAFARFDANELERGEALWKDVVAERTVAERAYRTAGGRLEAALAKDPTRGDVRDLLGDVLFERASVVDAQRDVERRDELLARLAAYDADGSRRAKWTRPGRVIVRAPGAAIALEQPQRALGTNTADVMLDPGSYVVTLHAPGREPARVPILVERGGTIELAIELPRAGTIPDGFVYVPPGPLLYGAAADEETRVGFFTAVPMHVRSTGGFAIARTEVTIADWLDYVMAQPEAERLLPNLPSKIGGGIVIDRDGGNWRLTFQSLKHTYVARWDEPIVYADRPHHAVHNWSRFPVTAISATEAERYAAWLDRSGRVPGARLCSELEWERAARGADGRSHPTGEQFTGNVDSTYGRDQMGLDQVGSYPGDASPFGLVDMSGNAFEWTRAEGGGHAIRGGSYYHDRKTANLANRSTMSADLHDATLGVRLCASLGL